MTRRKENDMTYWEKLKSLPHAVVKREGKYQGVYEFTLNYTDGVFFLEYILPNLFENTDMCYPTTWSGNTMEEVVDKAVSFFEVNFGKYELIKNKQ